MGVVSFMLFSFLCCLFVIPIPQARADEPYHCYNDIGNYTSNSTYKTNLNNVLSTLINSPNTENSYGFYNLTYGEKSDKVYTIGLCSGDVNSEDCSSCFNESSVSLTKLCPNQKGAIRWTSRCILRYSNHSIFGILDTGTRVIFYNTADARNTTQFTQVLNNLMINLITIAASGDSRRKYATGNSNDVPLQTIHGLVQCTPDLSQYDCNSCLNDVFSYLSVFYGKVGGLVYTTTCIIRYETYNFFGPTIDLPSSSSSSPSPLSSPELPWGTTHSSSSIGKRNISRTAIIVAVLVIVLVVSLIICVPLYLRRRKARKFLKAEEDDDNDDITTRETLQFNFDTIRVATSGFSSSNKLGQGGFGAVYKGRLSNGEDIAVKRLSRESGQGDIEFENEVLLVAKLQHRNLVRLLGFCIEGRERLLVYEFVPNKSLDYFIFDQIKKGELDWVRRYKIIGGIARGLLYLHEDSRLRIIHRDLKASNILLDEDMNPKISDFGMARLFVVDQTQGNTSRVVGTYGYMAPEYALHGQFSVKTDVFSFGVLVLEIVSSQKNGGIHYSENMEDLLTFVWRNWKNGSTRNIMDPTLNNGSLNEIMRCIHIGLLCVQQNVAERPTMASVVLMLNSNSVALPVPSEPAFFVGTRTGNISWDYNSRAMSSIQSSQSRNISAQESVNEASITEPYPR
ncbi:PREDICTED: putative receptor-like protein kinase At4g00960 [Lupinus angustifolius]|uniref:putative receptor-like protein kinase At4g00960 n=1 Tax=Lupinus angustifolius TaxID=3871 RepID=UPI00092F8235|nr:PREDICTED: putative receptor-like protein kinase At4g00960 [Lupinus angustifolius]